MRDKASGAVNQQERPSFLKNWESSETIRRTPLRRRKMIKAYLWGAMHDGTIRPKDHRYRIAQKGRQWLEVIQELLASSGYRSWIYQEGKTRSVYILESVAPIFRESFDPWKMKTIYEKKAFLRGFFDAEGGIPQAVTRKTFWPRLALVLAQYIIQVSGLTRITGEYLSGCRISPHLFCTLDHGIRTSEPFSNNG